jgi:carboxymethylenebutenolidase
MPPEELAAIAAALEAASMARPGGPERRLMVLPGAGHGFMCEARADFQPEGAAQAWAAMLALFRRVL